MKKLILISLCALAAAAAALPSGLSGLSVRFGGLIGDLDQVELGAEYDFAIPPYLTIGPEFTAAFGDDATTLAFGAGSRFYFIPTYTFVVQPYFTFGGGYAHLFRDYWDDLDGGYVRFGGGMDFEIPNAPVAPFFDMGAAMFIYEDTATEFLIQGGARFNIW